MQILHRRRAKPGSSVIGSRRSTAATDFPPLHSIPTHNPPAPSCFHIHFRGCSAPTLPPHARWPRICATNSLDAPFRSAIAYVHNAIAERSPHPGVLIFRPPFSRKYPIPASNAFRYLPRPLSSTTPQPPTATHRGNHRLRIRRFEPPSDFQTSHSDSYLPTHTPASPRPRTSSRTYRHTAHSTAPQSRHCRQVRRRARAFIRSGSRPDHITHHVIVLRHDERAKILARLLVPHSAIGILQTQHPIQIPFDLRQKIRRLSARLRNLQIEFSHRAIQHLPRPKQCSRRYPRIHYIPSIVAGVVPSSMILVRTTLARRCMKRRIQMTHRVRVSISEIDAAPASLPIIRTHRQPQRPPIDITTNFNGALFFAPAPVSISMKYVPGARTDEISQTCTGSPEAASSRIAPNLSFKTTEPSRTARTVNVAKEEDEDGEVEDEAEE